MQRLLDWRQVLVMSEKTTRENIMVAADELFYRQGFENTSFADIAQAVGISRGNFYHHFKSKDEILDAVIEARLAKTGAMLDEWERRDVEPIDRVRSFIHILIANQSKIMRFGCPVGSLCTELAKSGHPARGSAGALFTAFRTWLRRQFVLMGRKTEADELALHVLARSQGVATLAQVFQDEKFVKYEVKTLMKWLEGYQRCS